MLDGDTSIVHGFALGQFVPLASSGPVDIGAGIDPAVDGACARGVVGAGRKGGDAGGKGEKGEKNGFGRRSHLVHFGCELLLGKFG
jgi:hypothetical protein